MSAIPWSWSLVKISSSQCCSACPPVIIKDKDESLRARRRHQHASLLLSSERSTLSNPPAPNGPIYCIDWIVFGCTLYFQMFLWYPRLFPSAPSPLSLVCRWFWPAHRNSRAVWPVYSWCSTTEALSGLRWESHTMQGWWDTLQLQKHSNCTARTYKLCLLRLDVFVLLYKKKTGVYKKKSFLQAAPKAFPWGLDKTL